MDIQPLQILFQIVNFSVVLGALTYLLYKPILKILDERSQKIAEAQKQAEETIAEKKQLDEYSKKIRHDAEKEASQVIEEAKTSAQSQANQIVSDAKKQAKSEIAHLQAGWEEEKRQQVQNMKQEFNQAVLAVTEKVLGSAFDEKTHQRLIDQELKNLLKSI